MNRNTIILVVVGGVGLYLTYRYLDKEGKLAEWFPDLFGPKAVTGDGGGVSCPADAKSCPDGSTVSRQGPNCEFPACPPGPPQEPAPPTMAPIKDRIAAAAGAGPYNMHEWCWFFAQVTGTPCPDPKQFFPDKADADQMTLDEFWAAAGPWATQEGLSGLRALSAYAAVDPGVWLT